MSTVKISKIDVEQNPEILGLRLFGKPMFKGFFEDSVQHSTLLNCEKFDKSKAYMVQECEREKDKETRAKCVMSAGWRFLHSLRRLGLCQAPHGTYQSAVGQVNHKFACRTGEKRCAFCGSVEIFDVDRVGTGTTYLCYCGGHTFIQPPPEPFPWISFLITVGIVTLFLLWAA